LPQSVIARVSRTIRVADGVYAPGHLGELTQYVPFELVDAVLEETRTVQRRLRALPSRVGVYFVLALGLFPALGYTKVWGKLTAALPAGLRGRPSEKALRDLRRRLGAAPFKALFEVVAGPLAQPVTPGVRYRGWRTVAFDGCSSIQAPDLERNRGWLGKILHRQGWAGYPHLMLMALCETGTRGLLGAVFGPADSGERAYATRLLHLLTPRMLLLVDRGFDSDDFLREVARTGAQFLARVQSNRVLPVLVPLDDGSFLSRVGGLSVRVIDVDITVTTADGQRIGDRYRLITTLLNPRTDPASALVRLYHERWEIETAFYALRHTMLTGHVLRSGDPVGIDQELWALLTLYQLVRIAMVAAIEASPGSDPDRASFTIALETARAQLILACGILPTTSGDGRVDLVGEIGRAVLAELLPPRRPRISVRKVKSPRSRYATRPRNDPRPATSTKITNIAVIIHEPTLPTGILQPPPPPTTPPPPPNLSSTRRARVVAFLEANPDHAWPGRQIAHVLGITDSLNTFCTQLSQWAAKGWLVRTAPATYTLPASTSKDSTPEQKHELTDRQKA
jgi:hypothetical protein